MSRAVAHPDRGVAAPAITARAGRVHVPFLRRQLARALPMISAAPADLSLALVGDKTMSDLHQRFLGIAGPTDVLTFELDRVGRRITSGEVVICVPHAARVARRLRVPLRLELLLYALHGVLHLSGYDDKTAPGFRRMHRREDQILGAMGFGRVFNRASPTLTRRPTHS